MSRQESISIIEGLFPPDAPYADTAEIGTGFMVSAISKNDWRDLPDAILEDMAALCVQKENGYARDACRNGDSC